MKTLTAKKKKKKNTLLDIVDECMNGKPEANAANTLAPVERNTKMKCSEAVQVLSTDKPSSTIEGPRARVVLITEGLGNRVNMNYYGPEAIDSAPAIFEGKPAFLDHPSESDERDIPERRVRDKCGYFKNLHVESIDGVRACVGEIHFDLSDSGQQGFAKALTALHYKSEFPAIEGEYVGLSINANGDFEDRTVQYEGETVEVNYVTRFTSAVSCDIVTLPARGGRFLALVESAAGASTNKKQEDGHMEKLKKCLEAARSALKEALKETNSDKAKLKMAESDKLFDAFFKEAMQQSADPEEAKEQEATESEVETEEADSEESKKGKEGKKKEKEADDGDDEDEDDDKAKAMKAKKEKKESNRIVVQTLAKEAKVELDEHKIDKLAELSLTEAKAEIASLKAFKESIVRSVVKSMELPAANFEKMTESERSEVGSKNNELFANCTR